MTSASNFLARTVGEPELFTKEKCQKTLYGSCFMPAVVGRAPTTAGDALRVSPASLGDWAFPKIHNFPAQNVSFPSQHTPTAGACSWGLKTLPEKAFYYCSAIMVSNHVLSKGAGAWGTWRKDLETPHLAPGAHTTTNMAQDQFLVVR